MRFQVQSHEEEFLWTTSACHQTSANLATANHLPKMHSNSHPQCQSRSEEHQTQMVWPLPQFDRELPQGSDPQIQTMKWQMSGHLGFAKRHEELSWRWNVHLDTNQYIFMTKTIYIYTVYTCVTYVYIKNITWNNINIIIYIYMIFLDMEKTVGHQHRSLHLPLLILHCHQHRKLHLPLLILHCHQHRKLHLPLLLLHCHQHQ